MADPTAVPAPASAPGRALPIAVVAAGALLVVSAFLPWAGITADIVFFGSVSERVRGVDDWSGMLALISGAAATALGAVAALGIAGAADGRRFTALATLPGAITVLVLLIFLSDPQGRAENASIDLGGLMRIQPTVEYGWFAALAAALAVTALGITALVRR
ncbi:hypothetical protein GCM10010156_03190 [Planobispora rosea]|uniref:Uncharacterized protein n=1 Tax=Planobispora rosea TaxID=35762 RepID=A0A8J3S1Y6_PLARO|nr:hypothetical protein [Planobispora rosea]GGS47793.1 hypothetical protein GCM10010156_03190 [Planobispora rosea]GIH82168.1 hypothetical protein Pro02_05760 [Planobispora rosea]